MTTYWQDKAKETGDTFDIMLAWMEKAEAEPDKNYPLREKFPEPILHFVDWFVLTTKLKPSPRTYRGWIKAFNYAIDEELSIEDFENAWLHSDEGNNFTVTSPFSLIGVAAERKARAERRETKYESAYACPVCGEITCRCDK